MSWTPRVKGLVTGRIFPLRKTGAQPLPAALSNICFAQDAGGSVSLKGRRESLSLLLAGCREARHGNGAELMILLEFANLSPVIDWGIT